MVAGALSTAISGGRRDSLGLQAVLPFLPDHRKFRRSVDGRSGR